MSLSAFTLPITLPRNKMLINITPQIQNIIPFTVPLKEFDSSVVPNQVEDAAHRCDVHNETEAQRVGHTVCFNIFTFILLTICVLFFKKSVQKKSVFFLRFNIFLFVLFCFVLFSFQAKLSFSVYIFLEITNGKCRSCFPLISILPFIHCCTKFCVCSNFL